MVMTGIMMSTVLTESFSAGAVQNTSMTIDRFSGTVSVKCQVNELILT